jgi:hypothetical protein
LEHCTKINAVLIFSVITLLSIVPTYALDESLEARVAIAPFYNESDDPSLAIVGQAVTDTIGLTLRLLGSFRVEEPEGLAAVHDLESAQALADLSKIDSLVLGSVNKDAEGAYLFTVRLFDRQKYGFTITRHAKADSILDVFDSADGLTKGFLEAVSGTHIGFGAVELVNSGEKGDYELHVDGVIAGKAVTTIPQLLNGRHTVVVTQKRLMGELELARVETLVVEDQTVKVEFAVPYETAVEDARIDSLWAEAKKGLTESGSATSAKAVEAIASIALGASWSPRLGEALKSELDELKPRLEAMAVRFAVEKNPLAPDPTALNPLRGIIAASKDDSKTLELRTSATETADIMATLLEYDAAKAASARDWVKVREIFTSMRNILDLCDAELAELYLDRIERFDRAFDAYLDGSIHGSKLAPWAIGGGLALAAGAAAVFVSGYDESIAKEAEGLYATYSATTDSATASSLHSQIEKDYYIADALGIGKWVGAGLGSLLAILGTRSAIASKPSNIFQRYMDGFFAASMQSRKRFSQSVARLPDDPLLRWSGLTASISVEGKSAPVLGGLFDTSSEPAWASGSHK